eukprot:GHVO01018111.1.p1 GENE.GHVO01018111.1~~GHVO01018111.1.p1  ORF type:complete len:173 (+),score=17.98 GHVO01018111.1:30-521(+)
MLGFDGLPVWNESDFDIQELIGQGTYGTVHKARVRNTGQLVALKEIQMTHLQVEGFPVTAIREIKLLRQLSESKYIVQLLGIVAPTNAEIGNRSSRSIYMVFEWMAHDLNGIMQWRKRHLKMVPMFSLPEVKCIVYQLLVGLQHCHAKGVVHRDIKSMLHTCK